MGTDSTTKTVLILFMAVLPAANLFSAPAPGQLPATNVVNRARDDEEAFKASLVGDWMLENAHGNVMSPMKIQKTEAGTYELVRIGGGPFAVCGEYKLGRERTLVKVKKPNDAYWDLTWHSANGKLRLKAGQYKNWVLKRDKP